MFEVKCGQCDDIFEGTRPSEAMEARRFHMEQRHLTAKIETDT